MEVHLYSQHLKILTHGIRSLSNERVAKPVKAKATWLVGKIKCSHCVYALSAKIYKCKTKSNNCYYLCNNKYNFGGCNF